MDENQNSASPYARAPIKLMNQINTSMTVIYAAAGVWLSQ